MKRRAILFDLDGTLANTLPDIVGVVNRLRTQFGLPKRPTPQIAIHIGRGAEHLMQACMTEALEPQRGGLGQAHTVESLISEFRNLYYLEPHHGGHLYPDVFETLQELRKRGLGIGIATNKPERSAKVTLEYYLPGFSFDVIAAPENVTQKKPSPLHLLEPLEKLGINPEDAYFAGDDPVDLQAATGAGVRFFGISFGFGGVVAPVMLSAFSDLLFLVE